MRIPRIHTHQPLAPGATITLEREAARHLLAVLRLRPGSPVCLFNGEGGEYPGEIREASSKAVIVQLGAHDPNDRESPLRTLLGIGISRGERFEWVLQKATELGVSELFPLYTERTEVKLKGDREDRKHARWRQVLASACEQCGRNRLPVLHPPRPLGEWLAVTADIRLVLHHRTTASLPTLAGETPGSVALLVGPEGGLSADEIASSLEAGFQAVALGPRIFRTETAPVTALGIVQWLWGDLG